MMEIDKNKVVVGQIGLGKWGSNLFRNFHSLPICTVKYGCDLDPVQLGKFSQDYPKINFTGDYEELLRDDEVRAVIVATAAPDHYAVARKCLEHGKHVFVEKPITLDVSQAEELVRLSREVNKRIMVGHLLLYHPAITKLKELINKGELGQIFYIYTQRLNLGKIRKTENVMWSLAPHDISVILHLIGQSPRSVSAHGASFVQKEIEDVSFLSIKFSEQKIGHIHVSWLDPTKTRKTIVVGSRKMAIFDEISNCNNLILIDKGVDIYPEFKTFDGFLKLRFGRENVLNVSSEEPLKLECQHFIECVQNGREPLSNGENGVDVLKVLSAAERSLRKGGRNELLQP